MSKGPQAVLAQVHWVLFSVLVQLVTSPSVLYPLPVTPLKVRWVALLGGPPRMKKRLSVLWIMQIDRPDAAGRRGIETVPGSGNGLRA